VIVKPDASMVPTDSTYLADAQAELQNAPLPPMQAFSYSEHNGVRTAYVFAYSRATDGSNATVMIAPGELGIQGQAYVYNYFAHTGQVVSALSAFVDSVDTTGSYYVVAPIGHSQIALLGDTGKFVTVGRQRVRQVADQGILTATVQFAAGETSTKIQGYSPTPPVVTAISGTVIQTSYDPMAKIFTITVAPGPSANHIATLSLSTN